MAFLLAFEIIVTLHVFSHVLFATVSASQIASVLNCLLPTTYEQRNKLCYSFVIYVATFLNRDRKGTGAKGIYFLKMPFYRTLYRFSNLVIGIIKLTSEYHFSRALIGQKNIHQCSHSSIHA